ncbi:MAG: hypothetical protein K9I85_04400 [Saprospiraceae bacterium]|nr:hypothetical protein [Saprospiraceae bacterium]
MNEVYIVGEDAVTLEIIKRLILHLNLRVIVISELPVRGSQIKSNALKYNNLSKTYPVILLTDLNGNNCPIELIDNWFGKQQITPNLIFNIACSEAESWLVSDVSGFSRFIGVNPNLIPSVRIIDQKKPENIELDFRYKPSLFIMRELAPHSSKSDILESLMPRELAKKGPRYNITLQEFIRNHWNIDEAAINSYSLQKAITRLSRFK